LYDLKIPFSIDTTSRESSEFFWLIGSIAAALVIAASLLGLRATGGLQWLELLTYDQTLKTQSPSSVVASKIVLVRIDESDIQRLSQWPLSDGLLAQVLGSLASHAPAAIGLDLFRDQRVGTGRDVLDRVLMEHPNIVAAFHRAPAPGRVGVPPPAVLRDAASRTGFTNVIVDEDGLVRRALLFMEDDAGNVLHSFALRLAMLDAAAHGIKPTPGRENPGDLRLGLGTMRQFRPDDGGYVEADAGEYQFLIDYRDDATGFDLLELQSVLDGTLDPGRVRDKVILVGVTAQSVKDEFDTPLTGAASAQPMYGVEIQARLVAQLLRAAYHGHEPPRAIAALWESLLVVFGALLGALLGARAGGPVRFLAVCLLGPLALYGVAVLALDSGWWLPVVPTAFAWIGAAGAALAIFASGQRRQRDRVFQLFSRFCSTEVVEEIWRSRDEILSSGHGTPLPATIVFTDIVGFSTAAERLGAHRLMAWLNEYVQAMMPLVHQRGGIVVRMIGDAFMIAFGAPVPRTDAQAVSEDAKNAVRCALAMNERLKSFNASRSREIEKIAVRIGISSGEVVAGVLGDARRQEYNLHGDCVNVAARVEQLLKGRFEANFHAAPARILITDATHRLLDDEFETAHYDEMTLRGMSHPTRVYQVLGEAVRPGEGVGKA
jgi:adenylate cyclase